MCEAKGMPQDDVFVLDRLVSLRPKRYASIVAALVGELSRSPQLVVAILCDPNRLGSENTAAEVECLGSHHEHLTWDGVDLVSVRFPRDGIDARLVDDLEDSVLGKIHIVATWLFDCGRVNSESTAEGIKIRLVGYRDAVIVRNGVPLVSIQTRVDTETEQMLVVHGQHAGRNNRPPRNLEALADRHGRNNAGRSHVDVEVGGLVQDEGEDVLVVSHSRGALDDELAVSNDGRLVVAEVGVLPSDAIVNLVHADDIRHDDGLAVAGNPDAAEVGNVAETIAAQAQTVGREAKARVAQIKRLLPVVRRARIAVGNRHLAHRNTVEERSAVVAHIMENRSLSQRPSQLERPLLPLDATPKYVERRALWLRDLERLHVLSERILAHDVCAVLDRLHRIPGLSLGIEEVVCSHGESLEIYQLQCMRVENGREREWDRVVVCFAVL